MESQTLVFRRQRAMIAVGLLSMMGTVASWAIAASRALAGAMTAGGLAAVFQSVQQLGNALEGVFDQLGWLYSNNPYLKDYFDFIDTEPSFISGSIKSPVDGQAALSVPKPIKKGLGFENITFSYPESTVPVLDGITFELKAGENIGFGEIGRIQDDDSIIRAAALGGAEKIVEGLPLKLETPLGKNFEEGTHDALMAKGGRYKEMFTAQASQYD